MARPQSSCLHYAFELSSVVGFSSRGHHAGLCQKSLKCSNFRREGRSQTTPFVSETFARLFAVRFSHHSVTVQKAQATKYLEAQVKMSSEASPEEL